jgi:N6-adenosine-specific RNA methylase IME4
MIDPPWPKRKGGKRKVRPRQGRALDYTTLTMDEIFNLLDTQILPLAATPHAVFLWTVDSSLVEAEERMVDRGYKLHARLVWDKGNGVAPAFTVRYAHEYLLWFYQPKLMPVAQEARGKFMTVIREAAREHSRKPDAAYELVKALYPTATCVDVFSREQREGWDQWGNECDHFKAESGQEARDGCA